MVPGVFIWTHIVQSTEAEDSWTEDFDNVSIEGLQKNGWEIWDYDSTYFSKQALPGMLTLHTLPGDFWVKPNEERKITNFILKPIGYKNADITWKIVKFYPSQPHQQIGIFLFDNEKNRLPHLRVAYSIGKDHEFQRVRTEKEIIGSLEIVAIRVNSKGEVFVRNEPLREIFVDDNTSVYPDTVFIKLEIRERICRVYRKFPAEWREYHFSHEVELTFDPVFLGIGAFQGWSNDDGTPKGAEVIPGNMDWIEIQSVNE